MKRTDWKVVLDLAKNINQDAKGIKGEVDALDAELKKLKSSFLDDGIEEVEALVKQIKGIIEANYGNLETISNEFIEFADLLAHTAN